MVIINDKSYDNIRKKISFFKYNVIQDGKKRIGIAPFITFKFANILLELETTYDKKWLEELKIGNKKDISKYITDIAYEDEKGWISLIGGNFKCLIYKIKNDIFDIDFICDVRECDEYYKISLNERVKINFE